MGEHMIGNKLAGSRGVRPLTLSIPHSTTVNINLSRIQMEKKYIYSLNYNPY